MRVDQQTSDIERSAKVIGLIRFDFDWLYRAILFAYHNLIISAKYLFNIVNILAPVFWSIESIRIRIQRHNGSAAWKSCIFQVAQA